MKASFETRLGFGDVVYWISENRIHSGVVEGIQFGSGYITNTNGIEVWFKEYFRYHVTEGEDGTKNVIDSENLYKSKEELIDDISV